MHLLFAQQCIFFMHKVEKNINFYTKKKSERENSAHCKPKKLSLSFKKEPYLSEIRFCTLAVNT